jgi:fructokinase
MSGRSRPWAQEWITGSVEGLDRRDRERYGSHMEGGRLRMRIVVCGEALVDLVPAAGGEAYIARPGGSPANVAAALGRLDVPVSLLARLSTDHFGQLIRAHLKQSHVDLSLAIETADRSTVAMVSLGASGDAGYTFFIEGGADDGWRADALPALPADAAALHVSGALALALPSMGDALEALLLRERGKRVITFDPNPRPALTSDLPALRERLERWVRCADIVKVSVEDLALAFPGQSAPEVAARWLNNSGAPDGPALIVVTRGGDGVYARGPGGERDLPARPVDLVDTVGAGDSFMGGLLASLYRAGRLSKPELRSLDLAELDESLRSAQRVAAITCGRTGADPPWRYELDPT